jgi:hypothetical protein
MACDFERGRSDGHRSWRSVVNPDPRYLVTGDIQLPAGAVIRIQGESQPRTVSFVSGSVKAGWRVMTARDGPLPTGAVAWQIVSFGATTPDPAYLTNLEPYSAAPGSVEIASNPDMLEGFLNFFTALLIMFGAIIAVVFWML